MVRPRKKVIGGLADDMLNLTDYEQLEESENLLTAADLEAELEDLPALQLGPDDEGFESYVSPGVYGQVVLRDLKVSRPTAFNKEGKEVEFTGMPEKPPAEPVVIEVSQRLIESCAQLEAADPNSRAKSAQSAEALQSEVRRLREQMKIDWQQNEASKARRESAKAAEDAKRRLRILRVGI